MIWNENGSLLELILGWLILIGLSGLVLAVLLCVLWLLDILSGWLDILSRLLDILSGGLDVLSSGLDVLSSGLDVWLHWLNILRLLDILSCGLDILSCGLVCRLDILSCGLDICRLDILRFLVADILRLLDILGLVLFVGLREVLLWLDVLGGWLDEVCVAGSEGVGWLWHVLHWGRLVGWLLHILRLSQRHLHLRLSVTHRRISGLCVGARGLSVGCRLVLLSVLGLVILRVLLSHFIKSIII